MSDSDTTTSTNEDLSPSAKDKLVDIQGQLANYGTQIQDYLKNIQANVSDYKFSIEKNENGLDIDVRFKAEVKLQEGSM
jgi:hypothetical protein